MQMIADLHIHSRYSRACSSDLSIKTLEKWAKIKGVQLLGTGDFTHPEWIKELKTNLKDDGTGILKTETGFSFVLQSEISLIYTQANKGRKVHNVIFAPNLEVVDQITEYFKSKGRIDYDGRPIFKIPCHDLVYDLRKISEDIEVVPAHIWTPWFSLFGSKSGFDSDHECFKDQSKFIHALETGLSSDPAMNWRLSQLDRFNLISCSDLHSYWPWRLGREATVLDIGLNYKELLKALRTGEGLIETIEVDPNYGKYHIDGHRACDVHILPKQTRQLNGICPRCKKPLTIGVLNRVESLADRPQGSMPDTAKPFKTLLPLSEILSNLIGATMATKKVWSEYNKIMKHFRSEYDVLLNASFEELKAITDEKIANAIIKNRKAELNVKPGYDGVYGELELNGHIEVPDLPEPHYIRKRQTDLNKFF